MSEKEETVMSSGVFNRKAFCKKTYNRDYTNKPLRELRTRGKHQPSQAVGTVSCVPAPRG